MVGTEIIIHMNIVKLVDNVRVSLRFSEHQSNLPAKLAFGCFELKRNTDFVATFHGAFFPARIFPRLDRPALLPYMAFCNVAFLVAMHTQYFGGI